MGAPKIIKTVVQRTRDFKRMLREGGACVTLLFKSGELVDVFATSERAAKYVDENPASDYEFKERKVVL